MQCKNKSSVKLRESQVVENSAVGVSLANLSNCEMERSSLAGNGAGNKLKDCGSSFEPCGRSEASLSPLY